MADIAFGFQAAPASDVHKSDQALYREVMEDCGLAHRLGYRLQGGTLRKVPATAA